MTSEIVFVVFFSTKAPPFKSFFFLFLFFCCLPFQSPSLLFSRTIPFHKKQVPFLFSRFFLPFSFLLLAFFHSISLLALPFLKPKLVCVMSGFVVLFCLLLASVFLQNTCFWSIFRVATKQRFFTTPVLNVSKVVFFWLPVLALLKCTSLKKLQQFGFQRHFQKQHFKKGQFLIVRFWPNLMVMFSPNFGPNVFGQIGPKPGF